MLQCPAKLQGVALVLATTSCGSGRFWLFPLPRLNSLAARLVAIPFQRFSKRHLRFLCRYAAADLQALDEDEEVDVDVETQGVKKGKKKSSKKGSNKKSGERKVQRGARAK